MPSTTPKITDEQAQALLDVISEQCDKMDLEPTQILDGISRSLLSAMVAFSTKELGVEIENVGKVSVSMCDSTAE